MTAAPVRRPGTDRGTFANGMPYVRWGSGAKSLLFIQGGPGSAPPSTRMQWFYGRRVRRYVDAGYSVWLVSRRRNMPAGHTLADMADDFAEAIRDGLGGRVDVVYGESYGGMIAQYLAAEHPERVGRVVLAVAACEPSAWVKDVDYRMAAAQARGDRRATGLAVAEYFAPGPRRAWLRRLLAPLLGRGFAEGVPPGDLLVEAEAELACDTRAVLPRISVPVLLLAGERDRAFPADVVEETAALIPDCSLVRYPGGHLRAATSRRIPGDVLAFAQRS
jgi:pimeloyl-ACP methyl ester carboxylesterase